MPQDSGRSRAVLGLLVLACATIITLDARHPGSGSPVDPMRSAVADVLGPVENGASTALEPITSIPDHFRSVDRLRRENAALVEANDRLRTQLRAAGANATRAQEVATIGRFADRTGYRIVSAQVVGMGPAQAFSRTVTIDTGTLDGVRPDQTVVAAAGLVGRVVAATPTTATVLLISDRDSTVGGRLSTSMELGFVTGTGAIEGNDMLTLSLVDRTVHPHAGDVVLTWGSRSNAPYLPGIPIGRVVSVQASPAELSQTAVVRPYVDFTTLDVVGVVTGAADGALASGANSGGT